MKHHHGEGINVCWVAMLKSSQLNELVTAFTCDSPIYISSPPFSCLDLGVITSFLTNKRFAHGQYLPCMSCKYIKDIKALDQAGIT
jgi:hypothetical protein